MLGLRSRKLVSRPVARQLGGGVAERAAEYLEMAAAIGLEGPAVARLKIESVLRAARIPVFDGPEVGRYMDWLCKGIFSDLTWGWSPLRTADMFNDRDPYAESVPIRVLRLVSLVERGLNGVLDERFVFAVCHVRQPGADPFMGVTTSSLYDSLAWDEARRRSVVVFAAWDEPAFFERHPGAVEV